MLRKSLIVVMVAIGSIAIGQDLNGKFSFKSPAAPAKRLFQELTRATGTSLVPSASVANDVLVLNLSDVTIADAMSRIADAVHGEWRKEASGYVLYRGSNLEAADQRAENAAKVSEFRTNLNRILAEQKKLGAFNDDAAKKLVDMQRKMEQQMSQSQGGPIRLAGDFGQVAQQTPSARAIAAILSRMSDAQIASLMSGSRTVFGLNPTRMQMPMPNGSGQILNAFIRDTQTFNDVRQRNMPDQNPNESRQIVINGFGADAGGDGDPKLGIGYALLVSQPNQRGPNVSVNLVVADPNGKTIASGQFYVGAGGPIMMGTPESQAKPSTEVSLPFSEIAKEFSKAISSLTGGGGGRGQMRVMTLAVGSSLGGTFTINSGGDGKTPTLSDELRNQILNPERVDPLSIAVGEGFTLASEATGKDLVAYLSDSSINALSQMVGSAPTATAFWNAARDQGEYNLKNDLGWIIASPKSPSSSRSQSVNRFALGNALRQLNAKGFLSLDEWADFASKQAKAPGFSQIDDTYLRLINSPVADAGLGQFSNGGWQTLQFYASLSTVQRQALAQSGRVPMNTLSTYQIGLVFEQVFNSYDGPSVQPRQNQGRPGPRAFTFGGSSVETERTILMPTGVPRVGFLNMTSRVNEIVQAQSQGAGGAKFMNADSLAFERVRAERPDLMSFGPVTPLDQFRMASQRSITFQFQFSPEVSLSRQLEDNTPGNREFASFDRLPNAFRKTVEDKTEQLKKAWGQGGGNRQQPPPGSN